MLWRDSVMFAWNKMAVTQSCLFDHAVRESSSFTSKCYRNKGKTKEMFKFIAHCAFQKHANSEVQKPTDVCVFRCRQSFKRTSWEIQKITSTGSKGHCLFRSIWYDEKKQWWRRLLNFRVRVVFKSAVGGKMLVLDYFQLGLEKVKLFESVDRPNTTHKLVIM